MQMCGQDCAPCCDNCKHHGIGFCYLHKEDAHPHDLCDEFHCIRKKDGSDA